MLAKLQAIEDRYMDLEQQISDPAVMAEMDNWQKLTRTHSQMTEMVTVFREYKQTLQAKKEAEELLAEEQDPEFGQMVQAEWQQLKHKAAAQEEELRLLLLPKDPNDDKNVIVEIRGGAGGDEAALFAGDLFRMYARHAEGRGWRVEVLDSNPSDLGGFKEVIFSIQGIGVYSQFKFESGVHRVQRVPTTESSGRIHTSTVTVAVLPEAEDVEVEINANDLRIDTYCASGAGGQHVNRTESAVRITHLPSGIVVQCQDEKSQTKNREKAMRVLKARLLDAARQQQHDVVAQERKSQVGTGDRSERIRTYNFPQGRVTDHRIGLTLYKLDTIIDGDLDELIQGLSTAERSEKLANAQSAEV